jgi:O-antigen/teichoic acid export membrane protein
MKNALLVAFKCLADLAAKGSTFVIMVLAARRLSQDAFGVFSIASTFGWLLAVVADFGIQLHVARAVARNPEDSRRVLGRWLIVRLWTAASAIVVAAATLRGVWGSKELPLLLFVIVYACNGLIEFVHYFFRGISRSDIESSLTIWHRATLLGCAGAVLLWMPSLTALAASMLLPAVATLVVSLRIAARLGWEVSAAAPPAASINMKTAGVEFRREILPIGLGIVLSALYFRIDIFLVELWRGTQAVALYNAVFRLIEALRLFPAAVLAVTLPLLVRAGNWRPLARVSLAVTVFAAAVSAALWIVAPLLIPTLYGAEYAAAIPTFRILTLSFPLLSLNYALTHQLIAWSGERWYAATCGAALLVNIGLNTQFVPALSIDGAAWATLGTEVFLTAACVVGLRVAALRRTSTMVAAGAVGA